MVETSAEELGDVLRDYLKRKAAMGSTLAVGISRRWPLPQFEGILPASCDSSFESQPAIIVPCLCTDPEHPECGCRQAGEELQKETDKR